MSNGIYESTVNEGFDAFINSKVADKAPEIYWQHYGFIIIA